MNPNLIRGTLIASSIALALGASGAKASLVTSIFGVNSWSTDSANFTMLAANGGVIGGTNDVKLVWDGNAYNASSDYTGPGGASNVTMSSTTPFLGYAWTAHDIQMFVPGSYSFDTTLGGGNPETGILNVNLLSSPSLEIGMHMLIDWNGYKNIDAFDVFAPTSVFGTGNTYYGVGTDASGQYKCNYGYTGTITKNCLYDGPNYGSDGAPTRNQLWMLASVDGNGDGVMGIPMAAGGPLAGDNVNFNTILIPSEGPIPVPVPAAVWLLGSGLMGLLGVVKRRER